MWIFDDAGNVFSPSRTTRSEFSTGLQRIDQTLELLKAAQPSLSDDDLARRQREARPRQARARAVAFKPSNAEAQMPDSAFLCPRGKQRHHCSGR